LIPLGLETEEVTVLPKMHVPVPTTSKNSHLMASASHIRCFGGLWQKKSEMGSKIAMLLHKAWSVIARGNIFQAEEACDPPLGFRRHHISNLDSENHKHFF